MAILTYNLPSTWLKFSFRINYHVIVVILLSDYYEWCRYSDRTPKVISILRIKDMLSKLYKPTFEFWLCLKSPPPQDGGILQPLKVHHDYSYVSDRYKLTKY